MGMMDEKGMMKGDMMNMSMTRHHFVMRNGIDKKYVNKANPLSSTSNNITDGRLLYEQNCASGHGTSGQGDGDAGKMDFRKQCKCKGCHPYRPYRIG